MKKAVPIITSIIILLAGLIFLFFKLGVVPQDVLSLSKVSVGEDGKVYWVFYASANSPGEQYLFTYSPKAYSFTNASGDVTVTPKQSLTLVINPGEPTCTYQLTRVEEKYNFGLSKLVYYTLNNPARKLDIIIADGNNKVVTLDGTSVESVEIKDSDGKGSVVVKSQGLLSSKYDCPNYGNVAVYVAEDGGIGYFYQSELSALISSKWTIGWNPDKTIDRFKSANSLNYNTGFTNSFDGTPVYNGNNVVGTLNIGYPTFTITADSDYFDSTYYIQGKTPVPKISSVDVPNEIVVDGSSSGTVKMTNSGDTGIVYLDISSDVFSISGYQSNFKLESSKTMYFTIKAPSQIKCGNIDVEVCSTSEFSSNKCDTKSVNLCTTNKNPDIKCGDGICQSTESFTTCPQDCTSTQELCGDGIDNDGDGLIDIADPDCAGLDCRWYQNEKVKQTCGGNPLCWMGITEPKTTNKCVTSGWFIITILTLVILVIVAIIFAFKMAMKKVGFKK